MGKRVTSPTAIVTGGASGIGKATCELLARDGFRVAVADRDEAGARTVAAACGGVAFGLDVADEAAVTAFFDTALEAFGGRLDALATCAGVVETTDFWEISVEAFRRVYDINAIGTFLCIREAAKRMQRGAHICTVASVAGKRGGGLTGTTAYAASKGAVLAITKSAARSLAQAGIFVNGVAPGPVLTPMLLREWEIHPEWQTRVEAMVPLGRTGEAHEIAEAIVWLLSPRATFVHGEILTVDGGLLMD